MIKVKNLIGGKFVLPAECFDDISPLDSSVIAQIPRTRDVSAAVKAAALAQPSWGGLSISERCDWLDKIADSLELKIEELAQLESLDTGKPHEVALNVDAERSINNFRFFANFGRSMKEETFEMKDATNYILRKPIGIVGLISPWNLPLYLLSWKIAPALLMGNSVIAKPSEITPLTAYFLGQVCTEIGLPNGVLNIIHGYGPEIGHAIVEHPEIKAISFTGGTATGKIVAATAAPMFKKLSLELGGKNASIVLDDADLDIAVPGVLRASFLNSGQICLCGSRVLIHSSIYDEFMSRYLSELQSFEIGPVINEAHRSKILSYIELAKEEGGEILAGGKVPDRPGAWLEPTVVAGLSHESRTATEEIFGPMVTIHRFDSDEEAIEIANCTDYGLAGSVWSKNRGRQIAEKIDSGMVWVNTWLHRDLRVPFGGVKDSGVGREGGMWSIGFFSEAVNICVIED
ncbi:MAG: aldehyde dehydrogenase [Euryarchaeota archaeon]|jgi:aminomuconate-semialdehyde/2-hydroxymuconate-6-semialdehyde dehydrogenase|nr:aldehyde dehydrogenase [Euryarchaeota archaeon]MBT4982324.1 aldehyde dehydrogenase [Euryarchaeota archaeon]MBT5184998.1 aldehyde dehydrogenase [Euryarchaeota archaeon]